MTKLELDILSNYYEWLETPPKRERTRKNLTKQLSWLVKELANEKGITIQQAIKHVHDLILAVVYDIIEEETNESIN